MLPDTESTLLKTLATAETEHAAAPDEFEKLSSNIENVYAKLRKYLKYVDKAYTDATTGVQNKAAYKEAVQAFDEKITAGTAAFSVAFFDINGLKKTYTHCGFEAGDQMLFQCAKLLKAVCHKPDAVLLFDRMLYGNLSRQCRGIHNPASGFLRAQLQPHGLHSRKYHPDCLSAAEGICLFSCDPECTALLHFDPDGTGLFYLAGQSFRAQSARLPDILYQCAVSGISDLEFLYKA